MEETDTDWTVTRCERVAGLLAAEHGALRIERGSGWVEVSVGAVPVAFVVGHDLYVWLTDDTASVFVASGDAHACGPGHTSTQAGWVRFRDPTTSTLDRFLRHALTDAATPRLATSKGADRSHPAPGAPWA